MEEHTAEGGRNTDVEVSPLAAALGLAKDLGPMREVYHVVAIVLGQNYDEARDALLLQLRAGGADALIHPHLGEMQAQVEAWVLEESSEEGGLARFEITFVEAGEDAPLEIDSQAGLALAQAAANQAAKAGFLAKA